MSKRAVEIIADNSDEIIIVDGHLVDGVFDKEYIEDLEISGYQYSVTYSTDYVTAPSVSHGDVVTVDSDSFKVISIDSNVDKTVTLRLELT